MGDLLAADRAAARGAAPAGEIALGLGELRLGTVDLGLAFIDRGEIRSNRTNRASKFCLGRCHVDVDRRRIEFDQNLSGTHGLGVVGIDRDDGAGLARGDRDDVAADIGIVGVLAATGEEQAVDEVNMTSATSDDRRRG